MQRIANSLKTTAYTTETAFRYMLYLRKVKLMKKPIRKIQIPTNKFAEMPFRKLVPNIVTMLALCSGMTSIRYAIQESWSKAALLTKAWHCTIYWSRKTNVLLNFAAMLWLLLNMQTASSCWIRVD